MEITINKTSDCQATVTVLIPAEEVTNRKDKIISSFLLNTRIPGFRPGKAPKAVVAKRYANAITEELGHQLIEEAREKALEENPSLKVLDFGTPETALKEDGSFSYSSTATIIPEFELPEYMGIEVSVPSTEVTDQEVEDALARYAEASAEHVVVDRPSTEKDIAVIDFKTTIEGKPTAEYCGKPVGFMEGRDGHWISLEGDRFIPGLAEGLIGLAAGDTKDIVVTMKEDFPISELQNKEVTFQCSVKEVREKQVPAISPDLFAGTLPNKSMDEIRNIVRDNIKSNKERANDESKADQISEKLAAQLNFALPAELIERENENTVQRKIYAAIQNGDYEVSKDMDALRESCKAETERNLRVYFALQEIARREHIIASEQEMLNAIANMAQQAKEKNLKGFIRKLQRENRMRGINLSIVTSKVLDLLARNAKVSTAEKAAPEA